MKMILASLAALILFVVSNAYAGTWNSSVHITDIEVSFAADGLGTRTGLIFQETLTAAPGCATSTQVLLSGTTENVKQMTELAEKAFVHGKVVGVYFDGTCIGPYANVIGLALR